MEVLLKYLFKKYFIFGVVKYKVFLLLIAFNSFNLCCLWWLLYLIHLQPEIDGNIDPDVLAALPQSMQRQLLSQVWGL